MNAEPISELDLFAYAEGRLDSDPQRKAEVEQAMQSSPELAARVRDFCAQTEALRKAYDPRLYQAVPERLYAALETPGRSFALAARRAAAIALLVAGSAAAGWYGARMETHEPALTADLAELGYAHFETARASAGADRLEAANAEAHSHETVLDGGVSLTLPEPDLSAAGFSISARETVMSERGRSLRLTYGNGQGVTFALFLRPRGKPEEIDVKVLKRGGISVVYWREGAIESALASDLPRGRALAIADAVRQAMRKDRSPLLPEGGGLDDLPAALSAENTALTRPDLPGGGIADPPRLHQ